MFRVLTRLPKGVLGVLYEVGRHLLRRPVVGIAAVGRTADGRVLLIRRGDTGTWALPGGTLEWGETLGPALLRELEEEAGVVRAELGRVVGVYSRPGRDARFHAVTVVVEALVEPPVKPPHNPVEILAAELFQPDALPDDLAHGMSDMLADALAGRPTVLE